MTEVKSKVAVKRYTIMEVDPNELEYAINGIMRAFSWEDSPQGEDYWDKVHDNLLEISHGIEIYRNEEI